MRYLFILDYEHLDDGGFLKLLAKHIAGLGLENFMLLHGDSAHTQRIVQTGVMSDKARIRSIKELNHRLTALFADEGVPLIALNGFQRSTVRAAGHGYEIDGSYLSRLGSQTHVLLSSLAAGPDGPAPAPLSTLAEALQEAVGFDYIIGFDASEQTDEIFAPSKSTDDMCPSLRPKDLESSNLDIKILKMRHMGSKDRFTEAIST